MAHDRPDDEDDRESDDRSPDREGEDQPTDRGEDRPIDAEDRRSEANDRRRAGDEPDDEPRPDADRPRDDERTGGFGIGVGGHVGRLLKFLDNIGEESDRPGRRPPSGSDRGRLGRTPKGKPSSSDRFAIDLDVSIGSLGGDDRSGDRSGRSRGRRRRKRVADDAGEHLTTVRHDGDAVVVTADLPGIEASDLTVGVTDDGRTLVVAADREELARIPVEDWDESAVSATFNNFILEVRVDDAVVAGDPESVVSR